MKLNEVFKIEDYSKAYEFASANDFLIQEIQVDEQGNRQFQVIQQLTIKSDECLVEEIRARREFECFLIVNRGKVWYDTLSNEQLKQVENWYHEWLDAPATKIVPKKPEWII